MIFVDNLNKTHTCPNCGHKELVCWFNTYTNETSKFCSRCSEDIFQKTQDLTVVRTGLADEPVSMGEVDDMISDIEWDIDMLPKYAKTADELAITEKIQDIFMKMLKVIKEIK